MEISVLVVDINAFAREGIVAICESLGFDVVGVASGQEALEHLKRKRPSVVLTDIDMPEMTGTQLIGVIRADPATAKLPIIVITGGRYDAKEALAVEANAFLMKPFSDIKLEQMIASVLGLR